MKKQQAKKIAKLLYDLKLAFKNPTMYPTEVLSVNWDVNDVVFSPEVQLRSPLSVIVLADDKQELILKEHLGSKEWLRVSYWIESVEFFAIFSNVDFLPIQHKLPEIT